MLKSVLFKLILVLVLAAILIPGVFYGIYVPRIREASTVVLTRDLASAAELYKKDYGDYPASEKAALAIKGENAEMHDYIPGLAGEQFVRDAKLFDPFGNPLRFELSDGTFIIRSAGRDGQLETDDDVTNLSHEEIFAKYEMAPSEEDDQQPLRAAMPGRQQQQ